MYWGLLEWVAGTTGMTGPAPSDDGQTSGGGGAVGKGCEG